MRTETDMRTWHGSRHLVIVLNVKGPAHAPVRSSRLLAVSLTLPWSLLGGLHHAQNAASGPLCLRATLRPQVLVIQAKKLWGHSLKLGCSAVWLHGNASMRHPVELVLQVVSWACWAAESTASRPKIKAVRRSCMNSRCGLIGVVTVMEPLAQPYPGYSGGSCSVILASSHIEPAQSRRDLHENGSTFLGPKV